MTRAMKLPSMLRRRQLMAKLEVSFNRQLDLLAEMAAAYHHEGRPVLPEVGEALGAIEHRRRAFQQVKQIFLESNSGIGVRSHIEKFLADIDRDSKAVAQLLELRTEASA